MKPILLFTAILIGGLVLLSGGLLWVSSGGPRNPLTATTEETVTVMGFTEPVALDKPAAGWFHSTFWTIPPMTLSQETVEGVAALKVETASSASIFGRHTDIAVADYPTLTWSWRVETPIDPSFDENERSGDDHAARLFLRFVDMQGDEHNLEIIWSNGAFGVGEWKRLEGFPHYVAQSGAAEAGMWVYERVDLLELYRGAFGRDDAPRVTMIAIFCDSDDTKTESLAYFGDVVLER